MRTDTRQLPLTGVRVGGKSKETSLLACAGRKTPPPCFIYAVPDQKILHAQIKFFFHQAPSDRYTILPLLEEAS